MNIPFLRDTLAFVMSAPITFLDLYLLRDKEEEQLHATEIKDPNEITRNVKIDEVEFSELEEYTIPDHMKESKPVIIKKIPDEYFTELLKYGDEVIDENCDKLIIESFILPKIGKMKNFIDHYVKLPILYMAKFTGNYGESRAHIDSFPSCNVYYVKKGGKSVKIIPPEFSKYFDKENGIDNVYIKEDDNSNLDWLNKVPYYYSCELSEGDLLFFNNAECIHKFINKTGKEEIYTIRVFSEHVSPLVLENDIFNWNQYSYLSGVILGKKIIRDPNYT
jgi:hypothetical protein